MEEHAFVGSRRLDQPAGRIGAQEMRRLEFAAEDLAAKQCAHGALGGFGIFARHQGGGFRILAQRQDGRLGARIGMIAAVEILADGGGIITKPVSIKITENKII